ncbi:hypothetical protein [Methylobacterium sp. E-016]|uniref:hypothetical protein n=1 Tax=Methylobacterium sp. E-016 TaxID=2836556 RepID=UPI001FBA313C|nr:hypothetical protein [Methylobacterium sp. E-016]
MFSQREIAFNRANKTVFFENVDGTIGRGSLLKVLPVGGLAVERWDATGGTTARINAARSANTPSLLDLGGRCDGTTDDSSAVSAAASAGRSAIPETPANACKTTFGLTTLPGPFQGPGRLITADGNKRAPTFTTLQTFPKTLGNFSSASTAFNGDLGAVGSAHEHIIAGAGTLGQPARGYQQFYESSGEILSVYNTSGWNNSLVGNDGRTGTAGKVFQLYQYGQGDLTAIECFGVVGSTKAGARSFLANPEIACLAGNFYGGADGQYIEFLGDMNINDSGYDIAAAGIVMNFNRSNAVGGLGTNWAGGIFRSSNYPVDAYWRFVGPSAAGIDMSSATFAHYRLAAFNVSKGGSGYTVGDVLTVSGGTGIAPTSFTVTATDGLGSVTTASVLNTGLYTEPPLTASTYNNFTVTGGTGTLAVLSGQYDNGSAIVLPPSGASIKVSTDSGDLISNRASINGITRFSLNGFAYGHTSDIINNGPSSANNVQFGSFHNALGSNVTQFGRGTYDYAQKNAMFFSAGAFANRGDAQRGLHQFRGAGTGAFRLTADALTASTQNVLTVQAVSAHNVAFNVTALNATNGDSAVWKFRAGALTRGSTGSTVYTGDASSATGPDFSTGAGSTASITVSADTVNNGLNITFTPPTGTHHMWKAMSTLTVDHVQ